MSVISEKDLANSQLVNASFDFWFADREHIRSPFPDYIRPGLKSKVLERFGKWIGKLDKEAEKMLNDELVAEKLEEFLFEEALNLVSTEDERITILYPFLPRIGDKIFEKEETREGESIITDRTLTKEKDTAYLKVSACADPSGKEWETRFELPV